MKEALFYDKFGNGKVRCNLCRHRCLIASGNRGICGVRENRCGTLQSLVYGKLVAENFDPVEKKPLFHFHPGSFTYSIATVGCNFRCLHCQNYNISQLPLADSHIPGTAAAPEQVVSRAVASGCSSISYTYTEPTVFFEFALDTAKLAREAGLANIFVTNGYITPEALDLIAPYLDAANIDLKSFRESFYRDVAGASLEGVIDAIKGYHRRGIWIELTTLLIPGLNDSDAELDEFARFISDDLGADVPWHISRFFPTYRMTDRSATPIETLHRAAEAGKRAGLNFVYQGNAIEQGREDTLCPVCLAVQVRRSGFRVIESRIRGGTCHSCGMSIAGIWA